MANPTKFIPNYDFSDFAAENPTLPLPGVQVDIQFSNISTSIDETIDALGQIRRSDGKLANATVGPDQLSSTLSIGFTLQGDWVDGFEYSGGDGVIYDGIFYKARVAHTATALNRPDLDTTTWTFLTSVVSVAIPDGSILPVKLAAGSAEGFRDQIGVGSAGLPVQMAIAISTAAAKDIPVDADKIGFWNSAGGAFVSMTIANLKALLLAYFVPLFARRVDIRRNLWVNGSMQVSQENGNTLGTTNGYHPVDQTALYFAAAAAAVSVQRIQARSLARALDQIELKTTTAKASLAAGDGVTLTQNIEGSAFSDAGFGTAAAVQVVLRSEVKLPAGTYHWHFSNSAVNRHCAIPFTVSAGEANTAVVKEIVVPPDTSGTWLTADGVIGITCDLVLAVGSTKTGGSASTWGATAYYAATAQFNILSSTSNVARLADVGLKLDPDATGVYGAYEVGEVDPKFRCERYFERTPPSITSVTLVGATSIQVYEPFIVQKCKTPTGVAYAGISSDTSATSVSPNGGVISRPGFNAVFLGIIANARLS